MFDGWIDMGLLAQAFDLSVEECVALAKRVPYQCNPTSLHEAYDVEEVEHRAEIYARELINNPDQRAAYCVYYHASNARHGSTVQEAKASWDPGYKALRDSGEMKEAFAILQSMTRLSLVMDLRVERDNAVCFLVKEGRPFQKEVKGLTRAIVDGILKKVAPPPCGGQY